MEISSTEKTGQLNFTCFEGLLVRGPEASKGAFFAGKRGPKKFSYFPGKKGFFPCIGLAGLV
jgi:hypothetical protein